MATTPPPPPPPTPPPPCENRLGIINPIPCFGHAALPYFASPPVQETSPSPEALHEDAPATPTFPEQNGPQFPWSEGQEIDTCDREENNGPVQETYPALQTQMTEQQQEAAIQMDPATEDQLP